MQNCVGIHSVTIASCRGEPDALGRALSGFVQTVTETADDVHNLYMSIGGEHDVQKHLAFDLQLACLSSVHRAGLGLD